MKKKESICQFKSTMKKKESICQFKSTMLNQMCPNHRTYASLATTLIATSEATRVSIMSDQVIKSTTKKNSRSTNSRALTKKESLCQIKSSRKKWINMSIQEHHEKRRINNVNSRAPEKKGSICQF